MLKLAFVPTPPSSVTTKRQFNKAFIMLTAPIVLLTRSNAYKSKRYGVITTEIIPSMVSHKYHVPSEIFPKLFKRINISFHKNRNTTYEDKSKTITQQLGKETVHVYQY